MAEWLLWPETAELLKWAIKRAKKLGTDLIFCTDKGTNLYRESSTNPQSGYQSRWKRVIKRVKKKHPSFPYLPFGTIRDTMGNELRNRPEYGAELAYLLIAHGTPYKGDDLLGCYTNKPFGRLHQAIREMRAFYEPMFKAIDT